VLRPWTSSRSFNEKENKMDANPVKHGQRDKTFYVDTNRTWTPVTAPGVTGTLEYFRCPVCGLKLKRTNGVEQECPGCREEKKNV
jgi:rubrerythrin